MKTVRLITLLIITILVFSAWTPSPALAKTNAESTTILAENVTANADFAGTKTVMLTIINHTPGTLFVTLTGHKNYFFAVTNRGDAKYEIEVGRYTYTVNSSSCLNSLTKTINFKNIGSIGPIVCHKNLKTNPWR